MDEVFRNFYLLQNLLFIVFLIGILMIPVLGLADASAYHGGDIKAKGQKYL